MLQAAFFSSLFTVLVASVLARSPISLLISPSAPHISTTECLNTSYLGAYGGSLETQNHIYFLTENCLYEASTFDGLNEGHIRELPSRDDGRILWVGQSGLDLRLADYPDAHIMLSNWRRIEEGFMDLTCPEEGDHHVQHVLGELDRKPSLPYHEAPTLLYMDLNSIICYVPEAVLPLIDTFIPHHLVAVALPPISSTTAGYEAVPDHLVQRLANITANLHFSPQLDRIITEGIKLDDIRRNVRWLTGEGPSRIDSRHSFAPDAAIVAKWIKC